MVDKVIRSWCDEISRAIAPGPIDVGHIIRRHAGHRVAAITIALTDANHGTAVVIESGDDLMLVLGRAEGYAGSHEKRGQAERPEGQNPHSERRHGKGCEIPL